MRIMKQEIYWHTTVSMPADLVPAPVPERVDVAVIGGGYTGLSAARSLAKCGVKTAVFEAEIPGWGASSRNGGMTLTGLKPSMQRVVNTFGKELASELFQYSLDSVNTVERLIREERMDCGFARTGHLQAANKTAHFDGLKAQAEFMARELNHEVRLVAANDLPQEIGSRVYCGGLVDDFSAGLNPAQFAAGLLDAAQRAGAFICAQARVTRLERKENHFVLHTGRGATRSDSVLVATSGYTGNVTRNLQKRIVPIGSFIIATEKLPDETARELSPRSRMIFDCRHFLNYFRLWDGRLVFGGRAAFFPENENTVRKSSEILRREMVYVFPQLRDTNVEFAWGGTLDFAFDMLPHVGRMDGVYYSLGYAGHGVAMATHLGMKVGEAMQKGDLMEIPFARLPFPGAPLGLYNGRPWFLPFAGLWFRILDIFH